MATAASKGSARGKGGVQWDGAAAAGDPEPVASSPTSPVSDMLAALQPGGEVMVERAEPHWCAGFCGTWSIDDPGDHVGFVERLQHECGGGVYLLRPLRRLDNGQRRYAPGSVRVRVSGAPRAASTAQPPAAAMPPMLDVPARERSAPPQPSSSGFEAFAGLFERMMAPLVQRLAAVEARALAPAAAVAPAPSLDIVSELRKFSELRKLARELLGDGGRDDDDDDDEDEPQQQQQPLDLESLAAKFLEQRLEQPQPPQQQQPTSPPSGPRLIRNGVDVSSAPQPTHAPPVVSAPPPQAAPTNASEAAAQFAARLGAMPPTDALQFLAEVQQRLPPELVAVMQAAAQAQAAAEARAHGDDDEGEDDPHAAAYR